MYTSAEARYPINTHPHREMSDPALTPEELDYYASLDLADPDEEALHTFLHAVSPSHAPHQGQHAIKPSTPSSSSSSAAASPNVVSRRRFSTSALTSSAVALAPPTSAAAATAGVRALNGSQFGVTDVLDKSDLVGGITGMADAALQTRVVELPGRRLTSVSSIQCFLNVTHLYLQHNEIGSLEGLEMASRLQVLVLHHNALTSVESLHNLDRLFYLDLSYNSIEALPALLADELPCQSLQYLSLIGNPCHCNPATPSGDTEAAVQQTNKHSVAHDTYVATVSAACPKLECLDDVQLASDADEGASDSATTTDEEDKEKGVADITANPRNESDGNSSSRGMRRVQDVVEAARAAAQAGQNPRNSGKGTASIRTPFNPRSKEGEVADGTDEPLTSAEGASLTSKHATPLEQEEERLLLRLLRRTCDESTDTSTAHNNADPNTLVDGTAQSDGLGSRDRVADALQLYQSLQYTQEVSQARQQRDVTAHWDDVSRVLQTAQALQQDRRRRIHERLQEDAPSYTETLQLLQQESYTQDLNRYRKADGPPPPSCLPQQLPASARSASPVAASAPASGAKDSVTAKATAPKAVSAKPKKNEAGPKYIPKPPPSRR